MHEFSDAVYKDTYMTESAKDFWMSLGIVTALFFGILLTMSLSESSPNDPPVTLSESLVSQTPQMPMPGR